MKLAWLITNLDLSVLPKAQGLSGRGEFTFTDQLHWETYISSLKKHKLYSSDHCLELYNLNLQRIVGAHYHQEVTVALASVMDAFPKLFPSADNNGIGEHNMNVDGNLSFEHLRSSSVYCVRFDKVSSEESKGRSLTSVNSHDVDRSFMSGYICLLRQGKDLPEKPPTQSIGTDNCNFLLLYVVEADLELNRNTDDDSEKTNHIKVLLPMKVGDDLSLVGFVVKQRLSLEVKHFYTIMRDPKDDQDENWHKVDNEEVTKLTTKSHYSIIEEHKGGPQFFLHSVPTPKPELHLPTLLLYERKQTRNI